MRSDPPKNGDGQIEPHDHPEIPDECFVVRRIVSNDITKADDHGIRRIASGAFSQSSDGSGMSVDIEAWMIEDGLEPTHYITEPDHGAVRISVGSLRAMGFRVGWAPEPSNPHHAAVWGITSSSHRKHVRNMAETIRKAAGES